MDEAEVAIGGFVISGRQLSGVFELIEASFDHVAQGIGAGVDWQLDYPIALGWDHRGAAASLYIFANKVSIIALICKEHLGCWSVGVHDRQIAFVIGHFAAGQGEGYGQAHRIDAEIDIGRKAAF